MFITHRKSEGKTNMHFRMHEIVLHYFDLRDQEFNFVNIVYDNKYFFTAIII